MLNGFFNSAQVYETRWLLISLLLHIHRCIFATKYLSLGISRRIFLVAYLSSYICSRIFLVAYFSSHICRGKCLVQLYHIFHQHLFSPQNRLTIFMNNLVEKTKHFTLIRRGGGRAS